VILTPAGLAGAYVIDIEPRADARGFFARVWCAREYAEHGLETTLAQASVSVSVKRGTLRGMHYQVAPHDEVKIVRCTRGAIYDVIIDLRPGSPTYLRHVGFELSAANHRQLYIPKGFAHGFQTLADDCEVYYQMSAFYTPEAQRGVRWNDPRFNIAWPIADAIMNDRDRRYPDFTPEPSAVP
jgi:dTDP-4-dehydrorhamnose 3,5-epimerase